MTDCPRLFRMVNCRHGRLCSGTVGDDRHAPLRGDCPHERLCVVCSAQDQHTLAREAADTLGGAEITEGERVPASDLTIARASRGLGCGLPVTAG